ncbi:hypothetical protein PQX77_018322 [Marasmius sp. AFHP31]|nr:hypothetical protein PQX77_018322 [Marasmius sp. AFHP31]
MLITISTPQANTTKLFVAPLLNRHNKKKVNKVNADASSDVSPTPAGPGSAKGSSQKSKRPHDGDGDGDDEDIAQRKVKKSKQVNQSQLSELTNMTMDVNGAENSDDELEREIARLKAIRTKKRADAAHRKTPGTGHSNANKPETSVTAGKTVQKETVTNAKLGPAKDKLVATA